jgi:ATP-binding cassette subfamily B protein
LTPTLQEAAWSAHQIGDALLALARAAGLPARSADAQPTRGPLDGPALGRLVERTADWLGLEAEAVSAPYASLAAFVRQAGPAVLRIGAAQSPSLLLLLRARGSRAVVVTPTGERTVAVDDVARELGEGLSGGIAAQLDAVIARTGLSGARAERARVYLAGERIGGRLVARCWILRTPARSRFAGQLASAGLARLGGLLVAAHLAQYALAIVAWWAIGRGALEGHLDRGWLAAWGLLLVSQVVFRALELRAQNALTVRGSTLIKRRLFQGALAMEPEEIRSEGAGQLLGRTLEAAAIESLAIGGGLAAVVAVVDLVASTVLLALGPGGLLRVAGFAVFVAIAGIAGCRYWRQRQDWTRRRLSLTHDLVERMVGHRTCLAQLGEDQRHVEEDLALRDYHAKSHDLDGTTVVLTAILPAGWLLFGLASLAPGLASSAPLSADLAVAIGALLLSVRAMQRLGSGGVSVAAAAVAWGRVRSLFDAASRFDPGASPVLVSQLDGGSTRASDERPVLSAQDVVFRYRAGGEPVLRGCSLRVSAVDRVLLEGPSGGGKSTLALLLAGVRTPDTGTLLVDGLDRQTLGSGEWRRRVVAVPQFHENHVVSSTLGFNLLMGRAWPPAGPDMQEAETLCRELGLGDLLERMPSGMQQMVGDTGWQLSHGERSRVYLARALLQSPKVLVLDESFAALDPETMRTALQCVLRRAPALVVIAHP